jgi:hypothetical protein
VREAIVEEEDVVWEAEVDVVDTCLVVNKGRPCFLANLLIFPTYFLCPRAGFSLHYV